VFGVIH